MSFGFTTLIGKLIRQLILPKQSSFQEGTKRLISFFHFLLKGDYRYTSNTVFDSFPWPQSPSLKAVKSVAEQAKSLRELRRNLMKTHSISLRELYQSFEKPGKHPLKDAQNALDESVRIAYGMNKDSDPLEFLLDLNLTLAENESSGKKIVGPGLPPSVLSPDSFITSDCIEMI
jgi:hypothetical protein